MPIPSLISANVLICEKILREADGVISVIRLVDLFYFTLREGTPPEQQAVVVTFLATGKFNPQDISQHLIQLRLVRTNDEAVDLGEPIPFILSDVETQIPGVPRGFNIIAQAPIIPKQTGGTCYIVLVVDGEEVARTPFTLAERPAPDTKG